MKTLYLSIITAFGIGCGIFFMFSFANLYPLNTPIRNSNSYTTFDTLGLQNMYDLGQTANFTLVVRGFGTIPCMTPALKIYNDMTPDKPILDVKSAIMSCPVSTQPQNFQMYFPSKTDSFIALLNETGNYTLEISNGNEVVLDSFIVVEPQYLDLPGSGQYSIVNATAGIPVDNDVIATKMVGFNVSSPTYLPAGYQVKLIKVDKDLPLVTILASKYSLTNKTTSDEFFYKDGGVLITYSIISERALENSKWTLFTPQANKITIDGIEAVIEDVRKTSYNGHTYDLWADLVMFKGNIDIGVRGFLSEYELVKITKSMLENQQ